MDEDGAVKCLQFIAASWPRHNVPMGPSVTQAFAIHFYDVPAPKVMQAIAFLGRTGEHPFPPNITEIWKALRSIGQELTADDAFDELLRIASSHGYEHGRAKIAKLPYSKIAERFFKEICRGDEQYLGLLRKRFVESYELDRKQEISNHAKAALGMIEQKRIGDGKAESN